MPLTKYFITPNYSNKTKLDKQYFDYIFKKQKQNIFVCLRLDTINLSFKKQNKIQNTFMQIALRYKAKHKIKYIFFKDIKTAKKYKADGVHLKSYESSKIKQAKRAKLKCIISCHTSKDIRQAIINGSNYITYSPIFNSKDRDGFGIRHLKIILSKYKHYQQTKFFALGGIVSNKEVELLKALNKTRAIHKLYGFGSIRYFA
jgi:thiamine-phosphate pyrophosphorylase